MDTRDSPYGDSTRLKRPALIQVPALWPWSKMALIHVPSLWPWSKTATLSKRALIHAPSPRQPRHSSKMVKFARRALIHISSPGLGRILQNLPGGHQFTCPPRGHGRKLPSWPDVHSPRPCLKITRFVGGRQFKYAPRAHGRKLPNKLDGP